MCECVRYLNEVGLCDPVSGSFTVQVITNLHVTTNGDFNIAIISMLSISDERN